MGSKYVKKTKPYTGFTYDQVVAEIYRLGIDGATPKQLDADRRYPVRDLISYINKNNWMPKLQTDTYFFSTKVDFSQMSYDSLKRQMVSRNLAGKTITDVHSSCERLATFLNEHTFVRDKFYRDRILKNPSHTSRKGISTRWEHLNGGVKKSKSRLEDSYSISPAFSSNPELTTILDSNLSPPCAFR